MSPIEHLIVHSAYQANILPLTSVCNAGCLFCSHRQNPPGIQVYRIAPRTPDQVAAVLPFLSGKNKIVIGESVTKIIEGEPFTHPELFTVLRMVRQRFPGALLQVTTNGTGLTEKNVAALAALAPVELYVSLNSARPAGRYRLMGDADTVAVNGVTLLDRYQIPYHGSIVAMPWLVGWDDFEATIEHFACYGARTVRVFVPGYTRHAPAECIYHPSFPRELAQFIDELDVAVPVVMEPPLLTDLTARIEGVVAHSPAARAGLQKNDVILSVNGQAVQSRVHAFGLLLNSATAHVRIQRHGAETGIVLKQGKGERPGAVMHYDVDMAVEQAMAQAIRRHRAANVLALTAPLAGTVLPLAAKQMNLPAPVNWRVVENHYFGGSIGCAGLMVVEDCLRAVRDALRDTAEPYDLILLPAIPWDTAGKDLRGWSVYDLAEATGIQVGLI